MDNALRTKVEAFVHENIGAFHQARIKNLRDLKLKKLLENKNPYLFRAKNLDSAAGFVAALLEARLSSSEEGSFGGFLEDLRNLCRNGDLRREKSACAWHRY